jgi:hypothetical protein
VRYELVSPEKKQNSEKFDSRHTKAEYTSCLTDTEKILSYLNSSRNDTNCGTQNMKFNSKEFYANNEISRKN